jgi:hypothetical protein
MAALSAWIFSLNNIKQIEDDNGTRGPLFGRNATGGVVQDAPAVAPETPEAFEICLKNEVLNQLNVAACYYEFKTLQVPVLQGMTATLLNAAASKFQGGHLYFRAVPFRNFNLTRAVSNLDATFTDFPRFV